MAKDSKNKSSTSVSKEEKQKRKSVAKEEKAKMKEMEKEEKRKIKDEKRKSKGEKKKDKSKTDVHQEKKKKDSKKSKSAVKGTTNEKEAPTVKSEPGTVKSAHNTGEEPFQFRKSRFVMPRGQKGYIFPVTPGPARYPVTRINYPIMKARRQVDLTKKMMNGPTPPAYTMGVKHSEFREFYNKIQ